MSASAAALRGASASVRVPPTLSGVNWKRDRSRGRTPPLLREAMRSAERGRAGGGVAHLRSAEGVGRL